jgi:8-oxo-dGTP pyrophosphatase MutT (NUDIX family)
LNIEKLKQRLHTALPGKAAQSKMMSRVGNTLGETPLDAKPSAVLVVLFQKENDWHILYIQRAKDGHAHSGQIGFPGGKQEPEDADMKATALREAQEEVGIMSNEVTIIGSLTPLYIPVSNFNVHPFVAVATTTLHYRLQTSEVARVLEIPVKKIVQPDTKKEVTVTSPIDKNFSRKVPAYLLEEEIILWGASAMITAELELLLKEAD